MALSSVLVKLFGAQSFESEALDQLATEMNVKTLLKKERNQRYYLSQTLPIPCISTPEAVIFNANFYSMLQPSEVLAITAHEFSHAVKKHTKRRLSQILLPAASIALIVGGLLATNLFSVSALSYLNGGLPLVGAVLFSFVLMLFVFYHLNSSMLRRQETECDINALNYCPAEAMISVLAKTNALYVQSKWQANLNKVAPKTHPTTEQRIKEVQSAMSNKKSIT